MTDVSIKIMQFGAKAIILPILWAEGKNIFIFTIAFLITLGWMPLIGVWVFILCLIIGAINDSL